MARYISEMFDFIYLFLKIKFKPGKKGTFVIFIIQQNLKIKANFSKKCKV